MNALSTRDFPRRLKILKVSDDTLIEVQGMEIRAHSAGTSSWINLIITAKEGDMGQFAWTNRHASNPEHRLSKQKDTQAAPNPLEFSEAELTSAVLEAASGQRMARVERLKAAIARGEYHVSTADLAEKLIGRISSRRT